MPSRRLAMLVAALAVAGCRTIPLSGDPNAPAADAHISPPAVWSVDWWHPLVKTGLLEYQPIEGAQPVIDPDTERVIVATRDGFVRALTPQDGAVVWELKTFGPFLSGPALVDGVVYVACSDGWLRALKASTGELIWKWQAGEELVTTPTVVGSRVMVASQQETVFAVDVKTGKWQWQYRRDVPPGFTIRGAAQPQVRDGLVYMGFADGTLVALGLEDGVSRWEKRLSVISLTATGQQFLDVDTRPVFDDAGTLYAASYRDGVYALDAKTGEQKWNTARPGITSLVLHNGVLYATGDGSATALSAAQGKVLWTLALGDPTPKGRLANAGREPMISRGFLVVPTSTALVFVELSSGRVQAAWNPGRGVTATPVRYSSPAFGNRLYVLSNLGTVFALQFVGRGG